MLHSGPIDWQFGILVLVTAFVLAALLLPVPEPPKDATPTEDITKTRRAK